ncbi:hypothetical protein [Streptacidiphilus anmyonensis]|uniref:hypothetical protein n=1 Tax=Streptacidiphilus anmyonensis TaxID=405782 RepID=UPI0005AA02E6|nr:hypothetical protein [Streptacidiphilus anmyonensis]
MRRTVRSSAAVLSLGTAVAAAVVMAAPAAQAVPRPAATPFISCFSDAINQTRGEVECNTASSFGVGADTWAWTVNYVTSTSSTSDYLSFVCGRGDTYEIGMIITDSLGDTESGWTSVTCRTGVPN